MQVIVGKHDDIGGLVEPVYEQLTNKELTVRVRDCLETKRGKLEYGSNVYCQYADDECPYQKQSDKVLPYCEKR